MWYLVMVVCGKGLFWLVFWLVRLLCKMLFLWFILLMKMFIVLMF